MKTSQTKKEDKGGVAHMVFHSKIIEFRNKQQLQKEQNSQQTQEKLEPEKPIIVELNELEKQTQEKLEQRENIVEESLDAYNREMDQYYRLIERYSAFDELEIGTIISTLIEEIESTKYRYQETYYSITTVQNGYKNTQTKYVRLIIDEKWMCSSYSNDPSKQNNLKERVKQGQAIILDNDVDIINNHIKFYQANLNKHTLEEKVNTTFFPYVKDFIDHVISYRMINKKNNLSMHELETLRQEFTQSIKQNPPSNKFKTIDPSSTNSYYFQNQKENTTNSMYAN